MTWRIRKSPRPGSTLYSSIARPTKSPRPSSVRSWGESPSATSWSRRSGGRPPSSDDVPFGLGHREDVTDRPTSLGDESADADPGQSRADGAVVHHAIVEEQPGLARPHPATRHPAHDDGPRYVLVQVP